MSTKFILAALLAFSNAAVARSWETLSGDSSIKEARNVTVTTVVQWEALWAEHAAGRADALPGVDFETEMVVAVFLGEKPTSGWSLSLDVAAVPGRPGFAVATYGAAPPVGIAAQMVSSPFLMRKVPKMLAVEFKAAAAPLPDVPTVDPAPAQGALKRFFKGNEWYASWGYNTETWAPTDLRVSQPALGNDFTIHRLKGHDEPGWTTGIFNKQPTVPQYNFRVGRFIDKKRTLALEFEFDHTKYSSTIGQTARVTGTIDGKPVDKMMVLDDKTFWYNLHNGANHVTLSVLKRMPLVGRPEQRFSVSGIAKAGVGFMLPHADNAVFGNELYLGEKKAGNWLGWHQGWWQFDGWTAGVTAGVRVVVFRPLYLELTDKLAYARMSDVPVYMGTAKHDLWMNELSLSAGLIINGGKKR